MYLAFYGMRQEPFHITPDPEMLFPSPTHREALATLIYGVEQRKGFVAITGEVGLGKTTILRALLDRVDTRALHVVYVFDPIVSFDDLLATIFEELELGELPETTSKCVRRLFRELIEYYRRDETVVLVIDDAQKMPPETLEGLRILSNLETQSAKLLQIVLAGQPELESMLQQPRLRQLNQRIAVRAHIRPLSRRESVAYVQHRLAKTCSDGAAAVMTRRAQMRIAKASKGVPRLINILSDNALVTGFGYGRRPVDSRIVREVIADQRPLRRPLKLLPRASVAALVCLIVAAGALAMVRSQPLPVDRLHEEALAALRGWVVKSGADSEAAGESAGRRVKTAAVWEMSLADPPTPAPSGIGPRASEARDATAPGPTLKDLAPQPDPVRGGAVRLPSAHTARSQAEVARELAPPDQRAAAPVAVVPPTGWDELDETIGSIASPVDPATDQGADAETRGSSPPPRTTAPEPPRVVIRKVRVGDSLWAMMSDVYGEATPELLQVVVAANPDIEDRDTIQPGQEIAFPLEAGAHLTFSPRKAGHDGQDLRGARERTQGSAAPGGARGGAPRNQAHEIGACRRPQWGCAQGSGR